MLEVKNNMTRMDRIKQTIGLGTATNEMIIELKQLELAQLDNLRQFAASDAWSSVKECIEGAIDEQKELILQLSLNTNENAKVQRIYHAAVIDSLRILMGAVTGKLPQYEEIKQELKLRNQMQDRSKQETSTSSSRLLSIFSGSNHND